MDGYLLIDKPIGISSFGIVARVRGILSKQLGRKVKVGHTGTLDPAASGLMIIVVGTCCKRASEFSKLDKTYEAEITLGSTSTTDDREGEIVQKSTHQPDLADIKAALNKFTGQIMQTPPAYSAIKVDGQRAYKLARAGMQVKIEPRPAIIHSMADIKYDYPKLSFTVSVSSGTYIRSLAKDIGAELGTGAYLSALRRTTVGEFNIKDSLKLEDIDATKLSLSLQKRL